MNKKRNILVAVLVAAILTLTVGYALLSQQLLINTTAGTGDAMFGVEFTELTNTALNKATEDLASFTGTTVTFAVTLNEPSASANYEVTVSNTGTIDAELDTINGVVQANEQEPLDIQFELVGINEGDTLAAGETKTFDVKVSWDVDSEEIPELTEKTATISLNYVQSTN